MNVPSEESAKSDNNLDRKRPVSKRRTTGNGRISKVYMQIFAPQNVEKLLEHRRPKRRLDDNNKNYTQIFFKVNQEFSTTTTFLGDFFSTLSPIILSPF